MTREPIDCLHPAFRQHVHGLIAAADMAKERDHDDPGDLAVDLMQEPELRAAVSWALRELAERRMVVAGGVAYAIPFLDPDWCRELVEEAERLGSFAPNPREDPDYQIPEIVLRDRAPELYEHMRQVSYFLHLWTLLVWQKPPASLSSIQFAKYEPDGTAHGNWHHDAVSDMTAVVSLDPSRFEGGGTDLRDGPIRYLTVPPLPPGYALFFDGKQIMHRGRAVTRGTRHLLVFWSEC